MGTSYFLFSSTFPSRSTKYDYNPGPKGGTNGIEEGSSKRAERREGGIHETLKKANSPSTAISSTPSPPTPKTSSLPPRKPEPRNLSPRPPRARPLSRARMRRRRVATPSNPLPHTTVAGWSGLGWAFAGCGRAGGWFPSWVVGWLIVGGGSFMGRFDGC